LNHPPCYCMNCYYFLAKYYNFVATKIVVKVDAIIPNVLLKLSRNLPSTLSFLTFLLVTIIEFGKTKGFLRKPIFLVFPFGYIMYELSPSFFILPPESLIYLFAFFPFFQMKLDSFSTAPIVETTPLLDAINISSPSRKISLLLDKLSKSRVIILPSLFSVEAFKLAYLVKPPA